MENVNILKDYILPVFTFALGVIFTILWDKRKKIKDDSQKAANRLSELVGEWYNQLYNLNTKKRFSKKTFESDLFFYSQNRIILPELIKTITFLKHRKEYDNLIQKTEEFLSIVTDYQKANTGISCKSLFDDDLEELDYNLKKLDLLVQEIAILAGNSIL